MTKPSPTSDYQNIDEGIDLVDLNTRKEQFSYAYIQAVASAAGYAAFQAARPLDVGGIDYTIAATEQIGGIESPSFDLQVKCTSQGRGSGDVIRFELGIKNYDELRSENLYKPRLLLVVFVPRDTNAWLTQTDGELCMRYCGYWVSLKGQPALPNRVSKTIDIPRGHVFGADALHAIMRRVAMRQEL